MAGMRDLVNQANQMKEAAQQAAPPQEQERQQGGQEQSAQQGQRDRQRQEQSQGGQGRQQGGQQGQGQRNQQGQGQQQGGQERQQTGQQGQERRQDSQQGGGQPQQGQQQRNSQGGQPVTQPQGRVNGSQPSPYAIGHSLVGNDRTTAIRGAAVGLLIFSFLWLIGALLTKSALEPWNIPTEMNKLFVTTDWTTGRGIAGFFGTWYWLILSLFMTSYEMAYKPPSLFIIEWQIVPGVYKTKRGQRVPKKRLHFELNLDAFISVIMANKLIYSFWLLVAGFDVLSNVSGFVNWFGAKTFPWVDGQQHAFKTIRPIAAIPIGVDVVLGVIVSYVTALEVEPNLRKFWLQLRRALKAGQQSNGR